MKKIFISVLGLMLAGQVWAQKTGPLDDNSGWIVEGINTSSSSYELYEDEIIITNANCEFAWDTQLATPSWKKIGKAGDRFKLTFDVLYEGEESPAKFRIASGKTYPNNPDFQSWDNSVNTQIVDKDGFAMIYSSDWEIEEGKWTSVTYDYFIGALGADSIRLEIDHGYTPGIWHFKNFVLEVAGVVKYEYLLPSATSINSIINGLKYKISDSTAIVMGNTLGDSVKSVSIPSTITIDSVEYIVTAIGNSAFSGCSNLSSVILTDSIKSIGKSAFKRCANLTTINIPNSVTSIGDEAFYGCGNLDSITIPDSVKTIGNYAFADCFLLVSAVIPESITNIGDYAFKNCFSSVSSTITFPRTVTNIGEGAFYQCGGLSSVTIPESVTSISDYAFYYCTNLTSITIPNTVTSIGEGAFEGCSGLTSVVIPESVTSIGKSAFAACGNLKSVVIPESVTSIGDCAFIDCNNLTSITIPNSVTSIGDEAFDGCSGLSILTIPETVTSIGNLAFNGIPLVIYYGPAEGQPWGAKFVNSDIDEDGFIYDIRSNRTKLIGYMGQGGFVVIPNSVTCIGDKAFYECDNLEILGFSDSVKTIGEYAFANCEMLKSVTIPNSVTSMGDGVFYNCTDLMDVFMSNSVTSIGKQAFFNCYNIGSITIPNSVKSIGDEAFEACSKLTSITIPNSVTRIGNGAFYDCDGLTTVVVAESVTSIGDEAFFSCGNLKTVILPKSLNKIANSLFANCYSLTSITIPESVTSIGNGAFFGCGNLASITIPESVMEIGGGAFNGCSNLTIYCKVSSKPSGWTDDWNPDNCPVVWADGTAINESAANAVNIYAYGKNIVVENATDEIRVYNAMGVLVGADARPCISTEIRVEGTGVYIVKVGNVAKRVIVK